MILFNCTVKDLFRRRDMINKAVWSLADNGCPEYVAAYVSIRNNLFNAMEYASFNMKDYEYRVAAAYLGTDDSEKEVAEKMFFTHRTIRRYVRKACEYINEYYVNELGIRFLPIDTRTVECKADGITFWDKANSLMSTSIENACVVISYFYDHMSVNSICNNFGLGSQKVKKIINDFGAVITVCDIPSEKRSAV